jgi:hypothetical protein
VTPENSRGDLAPGFSRFWWGEAVPGFGSVVTVLALKTLVVVTLQGSAVQVGWLNSARWLPYRVFGLVVGALVDRTRRRRLMNGNRFDQGCIASPNPALLGTRPPHIPSLAGPRDPVRHNFADQRRCLRVAPETGCGTPRYRSA